MRKMTLLFSLLAFSPTLIWADGIVDVNVFGKFIATQPCTANCAEIFDVNFQFNPASIQFDSHGNPFSASAVPGTIDIVASGFLGTFTSVQNGFINLSQGFMPFTSSNGKDEIDVLIESNFLAGQPIFPVGKDTVKLDIFNCISPACFAAYGHTGNQNPAFQTSTVVALPEGSSWIMLMITGVFLSMVCAHWRRGERTVTVVRSRL